jgi:hypothetical protein
MDFKKTLCENEIVLETYPISGFRTSDAEPCGSCGTADRFWNTKFLSLISPYSLAQA